MIDDIRSDMSEMLRLQRGIDHVSAALMDGKNVTSKALSDYDQNQVALDALKKKYRIA